MSDYEVIPVVANCDDIACVLINKLLVENHHLREHPMERQDANPVAQEQAASPTEILEAGFQATIEERSKTIAEQNAIIHELEKHVQEATAIIRQRDNNIEELENGLFDQAQKLVGAEQRFQSSCGEIDRLLRKLNPPPSDTNPLALTLEEQLKQHIDLVSALRKKNTEVEARCQILYNECNNLQAINQELTKELHLLR